MMQPTTTDPEARYTSPLKVIEDARLRRSEKIEMLDRWEQMVQERLAATSEGMPANGTASDDLGLLDRIQRARRSVEGQDAEVRESGNRAVTIDGVEARQGSRNLTNFHVLAQSLIILALVAAGIALVVWLV